MTLHTIVFASTLPSASALKSCRALTQPPPPLLPPMFLSAQAWTATLQVRALRSMPRDSIAPNRRREQPQPPRFLQELTAVLHVRTLILMLSSPMARSNAMPEGHFSVRS
eukprot:CAMPEP_0117593202 /NCGR_PEP_ID=MMETSP0784-20121206/72501_1 /TAXON_ID=39447 /ORGANISM="" /LENGTH=109 /DNA_ID=CAMNT_0005395097 /DNA_START=299 /DNA_END=624 /DNA_ORIENTATION=-